MLYVDDKLPRHPKIFKAGAMLGDNGPAQALALFMDGLSYAREHLTDGFIPDKFVSSCGLVQTPQSVAKALSSRSVKLWHRVRGGYRIHDYHDWNKKASEIKKKRREERDKKRAQRETEKAHGNGHLNALSRDLSPGDNSRTSRARASTIHDPRTTVQLEGVEKIVPIERSAAPPRSPAPGVSLPSPLSKEPAADGNFAVIQRIAHEVFDEFCSSEPTTEAIERVKELCAKRRIDYGRHPDVARDVVRAAVESAAVQRTLVPVGGRRAGAGPTSFGGLAQDFREKLERLRTLAKVGDAN